MKSNSNAESVTAYSLYSKQAKERKKINPLEELYPTLPNKKYQVIYADPPWDYGERCSMIKRQLRVKI